MVFLKEGRLYIGGSTKVVTVNVHPVKIEKETAAKRIRRGNVEQWKSPSMFSWFNFKGNRNLTVTDVSGRDLEDEYDVFSFKCIVTGTGAGEYTNRPQREYAGLSIKGIGPTIYSD